MLTYSQQYFFNTLLSIMDENLTRWNYWRQQ